MTISSTTNRVSFAGNGVTVAFATSPVVFFDSADLTVYDVVTATGVSTLKTLTTDYTVTGGSGTTGTVTMLAAPATGHTLLIVRDVAITQGSDFVNNDASDAEVQEDALDRLTMIAQQLDARVDRSFRLADSDVTGVDVELPDATARALTTMGFDASGDFTLYDPSSAVSDDANVAVLQTATAAVATTQHAKNEETISVKTYGVSTSNTGAQNATALNLLLANIAANTNSQNRRIHVPQGTYDVAASVAAPNSVSNLKFVGEGAYSSVFNWTGTSTIPVFKFTNARRVGFEDLGVINLTASRPSHAIQFLRAAGQVGTPGPTACFGKSLVINGHTKGIAFTATLDTNNADGYFENVDMDDCDIGYAFHHSNSLLHTIVGGSVANSATAAFSNYMGDGVTCGGSFMATGVRTGGNATILQLGPTLTHAVSLIGHQSENDTNYITTPTSVTSQPLRVQILGGTFKESGPSNLTFDATSGYLYIGGAEMTLITTLSVPTLGPRVIAVGGFIQVATFSYNSYVRFIDVATLAGAPTMTNLGTGTLTLDHSAGASVINTTPITTANAVTLPADQNPSKEWLLNNGSATNLATLTAGVVGQDFTLQSFNGNTTLKTSAAGAANTMRLKGAIDVTLAKLQAVTLRCVQDGDTGNVLWQERARNF